MSLRRRLAALGLVAALGLGGAGGCAAWALSGEGPSHAVTVVVPRGATARDVADLLARQGVVRSSLAFQMYARLHSLAGSLQAGEYEMRTGMGVLAALKTVRNGPVLLFEEVTIPEGFTLAQIAARVGKRTHISEADFRRATAEVLSAEAPAIVPAGVKTLEGLLFPKTYRVLVDESAHDLVLAMSRQFEAETQGLDWAAAEQLEVSRYQAVVVASLVEREARVPEDRGKIARVIYNRLSKGMPLQIDATIQYLLPSPKPRLLNSDLEIASPYNTYLHTGLPPTPIASPGLASLSASLAPEAGDWLYYVVSDSTGRHAFTNSYQEFLRLKARYERSSW
ncbi:MAG: endolytic transglycosylase MltG [Actinomycetota bacterium]